MFLSRSFRLAAATLVLLVMTITAQAQLLDNTLEFPLISFNSGSDEATAYEAGNDVFTVTSDVVAILESSTSIPVFITNGEMNLQILVDENGALIANSAVQDIIITGDITLNSVAYSGTLFTGKVTAFGYQNTGGSNAMFDFQLTLTGGELVSLYSDDMGIAVTSENSSFDGSFLVNFVGKAKGVMGGVITPEETASLGDFVWQDLNGDGIWDSGESGIEGVVVHLLNPGDDGVCNSGDEVTLDTTLTQADGYYGFTELAAGDYCIEFITPTGYIISPQDAGNDDAGDSDADPLSGQTGTINLQEGENDLTWDAGLYRLAALGDFVWEDLNANGIQDNAEPGIEGVTVNLLNPGADQLCNSGDEFTLDTSMTDAEGNYGFSELEPGDYCVEFVPPSDYIISPQDFGVDASDSDADPTTGQIGRASCRERV